MNNEQVAEVTEEVVTETTEEVAVEVATEVTEEVATEEVVTEETEEVVPQPTKNVHVTNLPWSVDDEALKKLFSDSGTVVNAKVVTKASGASKGYGFVEYESVEQSKHAIEELNNRLVEERRIGVVFSTSTGPQPEQESNVLLVRNLSFKVNNTQLKEEFGKYGTVNSATVVRNKSRRSRGYAFVTFETVEEATKAKAAVDNTEVWERPLSVLYSRNEGPKTKSKPQKQRRKRETKKDDDGEDKETQNKQRNKRSRDKKSSNTDPENAKEESDSLLKKGKGRRVLFVKNLPADTEEKSLVELFSKYGSVEKVNMPQDESGELRGFCYLYYEDGEGATACKEETKENDNKLGYQGADLEVYWSTSRKGKGRRGGKRRRS